MPYILSFVSTTSEYAPLILKRASIIFFIVFFFFDLATNCKIISVSDELWKIAPSLISCFLRNSVLVKFPLCAQANPPAARFANKGWMFSSKLPPEVEYLTWPIAYLPFNWSIISKLLKLSPTRPVLRMQVNFSLSHETIPAPSWPLCCKECKPNWVSTAASLWLKIPKTPHSSFSLSYMFLTL